MTKELGRDDKQLQSLIELLDFSNRLTGSNRIALLFKRDDQARKRQARALSALRLFFKGCFPAHQKVRKLAM